MLSVSAFILLSSCIAGCGPSDEDVMASLEIINQGFSSVPLYNGATGIKLRNFGKTEYADENDTASVRQSIVYRLREEEFLSLGGSCTFTGYFDTGSCCKVDGKISYDIEGSLKGKDPLAIQCAYDFKFDSGKVKTIRFSLDSKDISAKKTPVLWVNEKAYTFNDVTGLEKAVKKHFLFTHL
ncbi:MAG: hypothetical protein MI863_12670 [Desulfobacterales bacterium]|nr:hypothetical protein [Desulfobacterales bacterium]